jgi:hypothetical protein
VGGAATNRRKKELWTCPKCGQSFVTRNLWHSCVARTVDDFFAGQPVKKRLFAAYLKFIRRCGPVVVNVTKTRISIQARVRFAGVPSLTKGEGLPCGFWLKRKIASPRFTKIEFIPPNNWVYRFLLRDQSELDAEVSGWIEEAYRVGTQQG